MVQGGGGSRTGSRRGASRGPLVRRGSSSATPRVSNALSGPVESGSSDVEGRTGASSSWSARNPGRCTVNCARLALAIRNGEAIHQGEPLAVFVGGGRQVPAGIQDVDADGNTVSSFAILEVREDTVLCDYNHPLAGVTTRWRVRVESVRAATEQERAQGYAAA